MTDLWWLSFADPTRPTGSQFLGAALVEGQSLLDAAQTAWILGCNPGGEVGGVELPDDLAVVVPVAALHILFNEKESRIIALPVTPEGFRSALTRVLRERTAPNEMEDPT